MTPEERSAASRIGGMYRAATGDMKALGRSTQEKRLMNLENQIDPDHRLPAHERRAKAELLRDAQNRQFIKKRWDKVRAEKAKQQKAS